MFKMTGLVIILSTTILCLISPSLSIVEEFHVDAGVSQLYPLESASRQVKSLNGIWKFRLGSQGFEEKWYQKKWRENWTAMAVPGSWQDQRLVQGNALYRDHVGWVFYQTEFYAPHTSDQRRLIYFGAVDHYAIVWVNGIRIGSHSGGHVSFVLDATLASSPGQRCLLTVAVNNTLTPTTLPQATKSYISNNTARYPAGTWLYSHDFDYFDYSGINRNVFLYTVPLNHISNIEVDAGFSGMDGTLNFMVSTTVINEQDVSCFVRLLDEENRSLLEASSCSLEGADLNVVPWEPDYPTLYTLQVNASFGRSWDVYERPIGFRSIEIQGRNLLLNGNSIYLHGVGMHEDADIRGRGWDSATAVRDIALLQWMGVNAIRTSHYPYSEELLQEFDRVGIMVILELPACSLSSFDKRILREHERVAKDVIPKYKHHPSIIAWSMANEPKSNLNNSLSYFMSLSTLIRKLDPSRPITFVSSQHPTVEKAIDAVDIICVNRYSGWYQDAGRLDLIEYQVDKELREWAANNKPLVITEYGAGTVPGLHTLPAEMWSEDYQKILLEQHFHVFDKLRNEGLLTGEMIWNFHDFNTPQEYIRPGSCTKGLFDRQRQPKDAADEVRSRYCQLRRRNNHI